MTIERIYLRPDDVGAPNLASETTTPIISYPPWEEVSAKLPENTSKKTKKELGFLYAFLTLPDEETREAAYNEMDRDIFDLPEYEQSIALVRSIVSELSEKIEEQKNAKPSQN